MKKDTLQAYADKRHFDSTPEPSAKQAKQSAKPVWVIQKHAASSLHYDLRLEVDGVLKSWAVPKGPSTDPGEKRLAVPTEDHPLAYAQFEGVIPEGQYGGGTVMIWDTGTYRNIKSEGDKDSNSGSLSLATAYADGHLTVFLEGGQKIAGGYALIRTGPSQEDNWLLVKMDDAEADARRNPVSTEPDSAVSGRSLEEITAAEAGEDDDA